MREAILILYWGSLLGLCLYGAGRSVLLILRLRLRPRPAMVRTEDAEAPVVTVQLPVYNEAHVVTRIIDAVAGLDWPASRLEIQILDDSTDATSAAAAAAAERARARGIRVRHVRRGARDGFKAGALAHGLRTAAGDLVAVFDADFIPPRDFLRRTTPFMADAGVGLVQARWTHLNARSSLLTATQAVLLDAHFRIEQETRAETGRFFNFNGTAGLWRRSCIEDAGGWLPDTLTEDLDLSYRAQLRGWRFVYLPDLPAPGELPMSMAAFRVQQYRWTKGSVETCLKLLPRVLASDQPLGVRVGAAGHLTVNLAWMALFVVALLMLPAHILEGAGDGRSSMVDLALLVSGAGTVWASCFAAQRLGGRAVLPSLAMLPLVSILGMGISLSNTCAVLSALAGRRTPFQRTPKYAVVDGGARAAGASPYRAPRTLLPAVETALGIGFVAGVIVALRHGILHPVPFLALFAAGFLWVGLATIFGRPPAAAEAERQTEAGVGGP